MIKRSLLAAAAAGLAVAGTVAVVRDDTPARAGSTPPAGDARLEAGSAMPLDLVAGPRAGIPGTASIAVRADDPHGGAPWAVRQFQRRSQDGRGRVWCAQLGRLVDGEFAWILPGSATAKRMPLGVTETTACALTAPISDQLGVQVAGLPTGRASDPATRISTTAAWGVVDRPVDEAHLEHASLGGPVDVHGHAFLRVSAGPVRPSYTRLVVTDRVGGHRAAAPAGFYQSGPSRIDAVGRVTGTQPKDLPVEPAPAFRLAARVAAAGDGPPSGIFVRVGGKPGESCATDGVPMVGDQPATALGRWSGLVAQIPQECRPLPEWADWIPVVIGAGWESGYEAENVGTRADAARQRRHREERLADESGGVTVGTPPGTRYLVVTSPVGVKVVRVTDARVTRITWRGQPEVRRALFPEAHHLPGGRIRIDGPVVTFEALDATWRRIGEIGTTDANHIWELRKRHRAAEQRAKAKASATTPTTP